MIKNNGKKPLVQLSLLPAQTGTVFVFCGTSHAIYKYCDFERQVRVCNGRNIHWLLSYKITKTEILKNPGNACNVFLYFCPVPSVFLSCICHYYLPFLFDLSSRLSSACVLCILNIFCRSVSLITFSRATLASKGIPK